MKIAKDGHLPSPGWSPTIPRMVNQQKEVYYRLRIWQLDFTYKTRSDDNCHEWSLVTYHPHDGHPQTQGWSPTTRKYTTDLEIWHLDLTYKTKTRWQLPWMVTYLKKIFYTLGILHLDLTHKIKIKWKFVWCFWHDLE